MFHMFVISNWLNAIILILKMAQKIPFSSSNSSNCRVIEKQEFLYIYESGICAVYSPGPRVQNIQVSVDLYTLTFAV